MGCLMMTWEGLVMSLLELAEGRPRLRLTSPQDRRERLD